MKTSPSTVIGNMRAIQVLSPAIVATSSMWP